VPTLQTAPRIVASVTQAKAKMRMPPLFAQQANAKLQLGDLPRGLTLVSSAANEFDRALATSSHKLASEVEGQEWEADLLALGPFNDRMVLAFGTAAMPERQHLKLLTKQ